MVSSRLLNVSASPIRKLVPLAIAAKKQGVKVYHLNIGDPDVKTPEVMLNVLKSWDKNPISYENSQGSPEFINSLLTYYHALDHKFLKSENIQVTTGGSEALSMAFFGTTEPGDEILVFEPFFSAYNGHAAVHGIKLVAIPTSIKNGFHLPDKKEIVKRINKRTKAILYCSPNNPTGTVYTQAEIELLVSIAKEYNLFLLSDEVYREYVFDGKAQVSLLTYLPEIPKLGIVLDSLSKRYSLCGARLGALVSLNPELMAGALRLGQLRLSSGLIEQAMATKLTEVPKSYITSVQAEYQNRRDTVYSGLKSIPGVVIPHPEGAFYIMVGLPITDSEHFCSWLLTDFRDNNETVMLAPGPGFYATPGVGVNEVRLAYVLNVNDLTRSVELIKLALDKYV